MPNANQKSQELLDRLPPAQFIFAGLILLKTKEELHLATPSGVIAIDLKTVLSVSPLVEETDKLVAVRTDTSARLLKQDDAPARPTPQVGPSGATGGTGGTSCCCWDGNGKSLYIDD